jgi:hypothetical protein
MKDLTLTLFTIDAQLAELIEYRQNRIEDADSPPTAEELAAVDSEIEQFMSALAKNVDGTAGLLLHWKAQREAINAERARLKALLTRIETRDGWLRDYVAVVMSRQPLPAKGPRRLRGNTSELVLRTNGGPAPLLVPQPDLVPHELQTAEITLQLDLWEQLLRGADRELAERIASNVTLKVQPSNALIRQELDKRCPACDGAGCTECGGTGSKSVPGAWLGERGNWIDVR